MLCGEKQIVLKQVQDWMKAYETRDFDKFKAVLSPSEQHISWGTGADEKYVGRSGFLEFLKRDFEQSEGAELTLKSAYVSLHENSAWVAAEIEPRVKIRGDMLPLPTLRCTFVLTRQEQRWEIVHTHGSWPYPKQAEGDSFPA